MTVFLPKKGKTWRYDMRLRHPGAAKSTRYIGNTGQITKEDAKRVEADLERKFRQQAYGIAPIDRTSTPSFTTWAAVHLAYVRKKGKVTRLDELEKTLRLVLQFCGKRPQRGPAMKSVPNQWRAQVIKAQQRFKEAPFHDLRLADFIAEPEWIERFEDWMRSLGLSGGRKNHYRSALSGMYRTALLPAFRKKTNVDRNPFRDIERDRVGERDTVLTLEQLRAWMAAAAPHARVAMAIAAYAPELRLGSILSLKWGEHIDRDLTLITVKGKTTARTGRPHRVLIVDELREILQWWRRAHPAATHVIWYHGGTIDSLKVGLRSAVDRANTHLGKDQQIVYGVRHAGATFHTIRHTMATMLAEAGEPEKIRQMVMGHASLATTQKYTHLADRTKEGPLKAHAARLQLTAAVMEPVRETRSGKTTKVRTFPTAAARGSRKASSR
jgi:integrase